MKIAHVIWSFNVGGAELMLIDIVNEQVLSNEVSIFIVNDVYEAEILKCISNNVEVKFINRPAASKNPWYFFKLLLMIKSFGAQVIHAHQQNLIRFIKHLSVPKVLTVHSTNINLIPDAKKYSLIISISKAVKNDLSKRYPEYLTTIIYNGINFRNNYTNKECNNEIFHIVQIGRLQHKKKGQDVLIRALAYIKKHFDIVVNVDFIGDGPSKKYLNELINELKLQNSCRFLGNKSREYIYDNLNKYDLLVQPSRNEGFGLTVVEAMAEKVPVLVSDIEGPMEIIDNGKFGYFFENGDETACANEIVKIINYSTSRDFYDRQNRVFEYVVNNFNIKLTARKYLTEYQRLISGLIL